MPSPQAADPQSDPAEFQREDGTLPSLDRNSITGLYETSKGSERSLKGVTRRSHAHDRNNLATFWPPSSQSVEIRFQMHSTFAYTPCPGHRSAVDAGHGREVTLLFRSAARLRRVR